MSWGEQRINARNLGMERASSLKLEDESFDALLHELDEPVPAEMKELMRREPQWA
ncbi:hypothetical protein KIH75_00820 [Bifidobacterium sp. 64T4]|uniref:hypothetical protein n=1 Tax=Bifidobacterium pongonis TaxID=2834432 RepID=UPI001C590E96|nr:hypothetical protein [Bifidobacterium pongonis]MBW3093798.1 hypothetical protein [Bifidobacterium pongonis]MBW3093913.1 hypothetical protein [Bifidobacterium pongonis]